MQLYSNYAITELVGDILIGDTTITVTDGSIFHTPVTNEFELLTITDGTVWEVVKLTSRTGNVLTVERGYEGTAQGWLTGSTVKATVTKDTLERFLQKEQIAASLHLFAYQNYR